MGLTPHRDLPREGSGSGRPMRHFHLPNYAEPLLFTHFSLIIFYSKMVAPEPGPHFPGRRHISGTWSTAIPAAKPVRQTHHKHHHPILKTASLAFSTSSKGNLTQTVFFPKASPHCNFPGPKPCPCPCLVFLPCILKPVILGSLPSHPRFCSQYQVC